MLTVHHLRVSQSERLVWLCEELDIDYKLETHLRDPIFSPPSIVALHPLAAAPVIQDGDITLAESGACAEYIIQIHGGGRLAIKPGDKNYADYLYWFHFANGTLQASIGRNMIFNSVGLGQEHMIVQRFSKRLHQVLETMDQRLAEVPWLAGEQFTAADIMNVFSLTTMRQFSPLDLSKYTNILKWFQRVAEREGYQRAMKKGDPEIVIQEQMQGPSPPLFPALRPKTSKV